MISKQNKRMYIIVALIVGAALIGTFMIDTGSVVAGAGNLADNPEKESGSIYSEGVGPVLPSILKMISALVVVLFALYGSVFLLKKGMGTKFSKSRGSCALEVLESTFVAPRKTVSLLRVADRSVLIGITEQQISVLTELDAQQTATLLEAQTEQQPTAGFSEILATATRKVRDFRLYRGHSPAEAQ